MTFLEEPDYLTPATITDEELVSLNRAIQARYGIDFTQYEPVSIKRRVVRIMGKVKVTNTLDLWRCFLQDPEFIFKYVDEITVGLTEMFRNPDMWQKLRDEIFPDFRTKEKILVWHAGCSTGEEVYTVGIMLKEAGLLHKTELFATDINRQALRQAQTGNYPLDMLPTYQRNYARYHPGASLDKYLDIQGDEFVMKPGLLGRQAKFLVHNLSKDSMLNRFDLIFCRNVMIYFDDKLKRRVLELLHQSLQPGGYLVTGYFDALPTGSQDLFVLEKPAIKLFRRNGD